MAVKKGGRQKGTPNKRTQSIQEKLEAMNCDPITAMARIAMMTEKNALTAFADLRKELKAIVRDSNMEAMADFIDKAIPCGIKEQREQLFLSLAANKELAQYVAPKRKAIEIEQGKSEDPMLLVDNDQLTRMAGAFIQSQNVVSIHKPVAKVRPKPKPIIKGKEE